MDRRGLLLTLLTTAVCVTVLSSAGLAQTLSPEWAPEVTLPDDSTIVWCTPDEICYDISVWDPDETDSITMSLFSGPIEYETQTFGYEFTTTVCFLPEADGEYEFVWRFTDLQNHVVLDTVVYTVVTGSAPSIEDQQFSDEACDLKAERTLDLEYTGEGAGLAFELISGIGSIDPQTGTITYVPDTSGTFIFEVGLTSECGGDTATITDQLVLNLPPYCIGFDSTIYLCEAEEICFEVFAFDPEDDPITITMLEGLGSFQQTTDSSGVTCFTPADADSARYMFIFKTADPCVLGEGGALSDPYCCLDTVKIDVIITQPGNLTCAPDTTVSLCTPPLELPQEVCIPGFESTWETTEVSFGTLEDGTVCFMADTLGVYTIELSGSDSCGNYGSCMTTVTVKGNNVPYVTMADDYSIMLCNPEEVCFRASADDLDFDLADVLVNYGSYNPEYNYYCFEADTAGVYTLILTAVDECGAEAVDSTVVTVGMSDTPTVSLGDDRTVDLCESEEVCIDATITGKQIMFMGTSDGAHYNGNNESGQVCFTPDTSGTYEIFLMVVNACEFEAADTVNVTVNIGSAPVITGLPDSSLYICYPTEICLPFEVSDPDNDIVSITTNRGQIKDGEVCFVPYTKADYNVIITAVDECGHETADTALVSVFTDQGIDLVCPGDTTIFLCEPQTLCFPIGGIPDGVEVTVDGTDVYWNEETQSVCFYTDQSLNNEITVSATTACDTYSCTFDVSVRMNSAPTVAFPDDATTLQCTPGPICIQVDIDDIDGNIAEITTEGGTYSAQSGMVCFDVEAEGIYTVSLQATDSCGAVGSDEIQVTVELNDAPWIESSFSQESILLCEPEGIVIPISYGDANGGELTITSPDTDSLIYDDQSGLVTAIVFLPPSFGDFCAKAVVTDECAVADTVEVCFSLGTWERVSILDHDPIEEYMCGTGQYCTELPIVGDDVVVTVDRGAWTNGSWCVDVKELIDGDLTVIATGPCNADTSVVPIHLEPITSPTTECPADLDTLLCGPTTLEFELPLPTGEGPFEEVTVSSPAWVEVVDRVAHVFVPFEEAGQQTIEVTHSSDPCEPYVCSFTVTAAMNQAPTITAENMTLDLCELGEICLPFSYFDAEGDITGITTTLGGITYDQGEGQVCFTPDAFGEYPITLKITDECESVDEATVTVTINQIPEVAIDCPVFDTPPTYCDPGPYCIDLPISGDPGTVTSTFGTWADGQLCFDFSNLDPGDYTAEITAVGECNTDYCSITVVYMAPAMVSCSVADTTILFCAEASQIVQVPVEITGEDLTLDIQPAGCTYADGMVSVPVESAGTYPVTVIAFNTCSADTCGFTVNVNINTPPTVDLGEDVTFTQCELTQVCVPYHITDIDENLLELRTNIGVIVNGDVCFTPKNFGTYELIVSAEDECETFGRDTIMITVEQDQFVTMTCPPELTSVNIDLPGTVAIDVPIDLPEAVVTVSPDGYYDFDNQQVIVPIEAEGLHEFTIIAAATCNADTCDFFIEVGEYIPPHVECRGTVDTLLCLSEPRTVCMPISVFGTDVQVTVSEPATYDGESVCIDISEPGEYVIDIEAATDRETATCRTTLYVTGGNAPLLEMPESLEYTLCQPGDVCFDVVMEDAEFDITSIDVSYGTYDPVEGRLCFVADTAGVYEIEITVADSCGNMAQDMTTVAVDFNAMPTISLGDDREVFGCVLDEICVDVTVADDDLVTVGTNLGTYNENTGQICFTPEANGVYDLIATAVDQCGHEVADTIAIDVAANRPPIMAPLRDTTVYICYPTEICLDVDVTDPDDNLASITTTRGSYADGRVCFVPYSMGEYPVVVTATDECGLTVKDTAMVTIVTDQGINLVCPGDTTVFLCEPETLCFPIGGIPEGAEVTVDGVATFWDDENQSICFTSDCCIDNDLTVYVTTPCGTYSCSFRVSVQTNSRPLVILPKDTTIMQCELGEICLPAGISDIDGNIMSVEVEGGSYDSYARTICFTPNAEGSYPLSISVTDSCGLVGTDDMVVGVVLNQAPVISYTPDNTIYKQCEPEEICVPIGFSDIDDNIADISVVGGRYDSDMQSICILPDGTGTFCAQVTVTDECGLTADQEVCVYVEAGDYVAIECNETPTPPQDLCEPQTVCFPLPITGDNFAVSTDYGSWADNELCFLADTTGTYMVTVIAEAQCISDTCVVTVPITVLEPLEVVCPESDSLFLCAPSVESYEFTYQPTSAEVTVSEPAYLEGGMVMVPINEAGTQTITITVANHCGSVDCSFDVKAVFNTAPTVSLGEDLDMTECDLHEVCIPVTWSDPDDNGRQWAVTITPDAPGFSAGDTEVCFTPPDYGQYTILYTAMDDCVASDADTVVVDYTEGKYASIECPDGAQYASLCGADSVCILAPIYDAETITIQPNGVYKPESGEVCVYVTEGGTQEITIIAAASCASDTCSFNLEVEMGEVPVIECPEHIDTLLCLVETDTLRVPVTVTGTGVQVNVNPDGYYSAGTVNLPISEAGDYSFQLIAFGSCGADTCEVSVTVEADEEPVLTLPETMTFERCPDDIDPICIGGIFATDVESDVVITQVCGPGEFTAGPSADSGGVCFVPTAFGQIELCFEADDGCHVVGGSMFVNIVSRDDCDVCVRLSIDGGDETPVGLRKNVAVNIETHDPIGGFDLLIGYDASALTYLTATMDGGDADDWEYFTWEIDNAGCGSACPSGLVRFFAIADYNNGAAHPPESAYTPSGQLFTMEFQVANDQNLGDQFVPISFVWRSCTDNGISDTTGSLLYVDTRIYGPEMSLLWDEFDEVNFPETARQFGLGAADSCLVGSEKGEPVRCVEYINGGIKIIDPDDIDARGDINLNLIAYEIADAVVFTNYFIRGLDAFTINIAGQIAATDVNGDGLTLTVADLSLLIRIIIGDADPLPKTTPHLTAADVSSRVTDGQLRIGANTTNGVGAAYFVYDIPEGVTIGEPEATSETEGFDLVKGVRDGQLHLLMFDIGTNEVSAGQHDLINVPVFGDGQLTLVHSELVDYNSRPYTARLASILPDEYELKQNYPNPFNPSTTIAFALPNASDWKLSVYNIAGAMVWSTNGTSPGGNIEVVWDGRNLDGKSVASGVYLYRLEAGTFSNTRKMILLK